MILNDIIIGIDVDGVVSDTYPHWLHLNQLSGGAHYDLSEIYGERAKNDKRLLDLLSRSDLYDGVQPISNAIEAIKYLQSKYRIVFVTSCVLGMADAKWIWLQKYGLLPSGNLQTNALIMTHDKSLVNLDIHLDDSIPTLKNTRAQYKLLFDQPWNRYLETDGLYRVNGWNEAVSAIETAVKNILKRKYISDNDLQTLEIRG